MRFTKAQILQEIKRTAKANGGVALGIKRFVNETGITESECIGMYWARWSDAVREAGLKPNIVPLRIGEKTLVKKYVELAKEIGRLPSFADLKLKRRTDTEFPSHNVFLFRFRRLAELHKQAAEYCRGKEGFEEVGAWCEKGRARNSGPRDRELPP